MQDEEGPMDGDADAVMKMLMETESRYKELTLQFDQHYERWTCFIQVGTPTLLKCCRPSPFSCFTSHLCVCTCVCFRRSLLTEKGCLLRRR